MFSSYSLAVGVDELQLQDPAKEALAREEFKKYRCLVCQNQS
ncbi:MAG: cytochrome c-type biogenesis protein CcmH, partial [Alphaproteobacteria bacterium]